MFILLLYSTQFSPAIELPADDIVAVFNKALPRYSNRNLQSIYEDDGAKVYELNANRRIVVCTSYKQIKCDSEEEACLISHKNYFHSIVNMVSESQPMEWIFTEKCYPEFGVGRWVNHSNGIAMKIVSELLQSNRNYSHNQLKIITFFDYSHKIDYYNSLDELIGCENILKFKYSPLWTNYICYDHGPGIPIYLLFNERCYISEDKIRRCVADYKTRYASEVEAKDVGQVSIFNAYRGPMRYIE